MTEFNNVFDCNLSNGGYVHILTLDGDYIGEVGRGNLIGPCHVMVDLYGFMFVADIYDNRVAIFDRNGKKIHSFGSKDSHFAETMKPRGVAYMYNNYNNSIYIVDQGNRQVQIFKLGTDSYLMCYIILVTCRL